MSESLYSTIFKARYLSAQFWIPCFGTDEQGFFVFLVLPTQPVEKLLWKDTNQKLLFSSAVLNDMATRLENF